jgi:hypothetical protein
MYLVEKFNVLEDKSTETIKNNQKGKNKFKN